MKGSVTPLHLVSPGIPEVDPERTAISYINSLSRDDFAGNGAVQLSASGKIAKP
jgi:hypothetical protein